MRARQLLDAYGVTPQQRGTTAFLLVPRLQALVDFMHTAADAGNANFAHHIAEGHADLYRQDISYISARIEGWREIIIEDGIQP